MIEQQNHDISVMVVSTPFEYTDYVRPACLPDTSGFKITKARERKPRCIISGWGTTEKGQLADDLLYRDIPMHSFQQCKKEVHGRITKYGICGGGKGPDTCQGKLQKRYSFDQCRTYTKYNTLLSICASGRFSCFFYCRLKNVSRIHPQRELQRLLANRYVSSNCYAFWSLLYTLKIQIVTIFSLAFFDYRFDF